MCLGVGRSEFFSAVDLERVEADLKRLRKILADIPAIVSAEALVAKIGCCLKLYSGEMTTGVIRKIIFKQACHSSNTRRRELDQ